MTNSKFNQETFMKIDDKVERFMGNPPDITRNTAISKRTVSLKSKLSYVLLPDCESFVSLNQLLDLAAPSVTKNGIYKFPFPYLSLPKRPKKLLITGWPGEGSLVVLGDCDCLSIEGEAEGVIESSATFYGSLPHEWVLPDKPHLINKENEIMLFGNTVLKINGVEQGNCFTGFDFNIDRGAKSSRLNLRFDNVKGNQFKNTPSWPNKNNTSVVEIIVNSSDGTRKITLNMRCVSMGWDYTSSDVLGLNTNFIIIKGSFALSGVGDE